MREQFCNDKTRYTYCVTAKLITTYDLSPVSTPYADKSYLYVFEFEHNKKIYKYRIMNDIVSETITLCFDDPKNIYRLKTSEINTNENMMSLKKFETILWIFVIMTVVFIVYVFLNFFKDLNDAISISLDNVPFIVIFLILGVIVNKSVIKRQKYLKQVPEKIEKAILNGHTAIAHLERWYTRLRDSEDSSTVRTSVRNYPYGAKYKYNGRNYTYRDTFMNIPKEEIKLFFDKNPKDIVYRCE